jgi:hypothetical protein
LGRPVAAPADRGVAARGVRFDIRGNPPAPPFCIEACGPLLGWTQNTIGAERGFGEMRMWLVERGGAVFVASENAPDERSLSVTAAMLDSVRFTS